MLHIYQKIFQKKFTECNSVNNLYYAHLEVWWIVFEQFDEAILYWK